MDILAKILEDFAPFEVNEGKAHNHVPEERASLFTTYGIDPATTEREHIELLYSLIRVAKPRNVLETGTGMGVATLVMAAALEWNGQAGKITTVDSRYLGTIYDVAHRYGLQHRLNVVTQDSLQWLLDFERVEDRTTFDFCFFDSVQERKAVEAKKLIALNMIEPGALLVFHDTSKTRFNEEGHPDALNAKYLDDLTELQGNKCCLVFSLSRGLTIIRQPV